MVGGETVSPHWHEVKPCRKNTGCGLKQSAKSKLETMRKGRFIRPFLHVKNYTENYDYLKFCHINSKKAGEGRK